MIKKVILLTIDCLRRDRLRIFGQDQNLIPHINKLSNESFCFNNAISNSTNTPPSFYSLFTSQLPTIKTPYAPLPIGEKTIYKILKKHGIKTCGIHSNPHIGIYCNYHYGFDDFFDMFENPRLYSQKNKVIRFSFQFINQIVVRLKSLKYFRKLNEKLYDLSKKIKPKKLVHSNESSLPYLDAKVITTQSIEWLSNNYDSNFFLWIHYMDAHTPYNPPEKNLKSIYVNEISEEIKLEIINMIDNVGKKPELAKSIDIKKYSPIIEALYNAELNYIDYYLGIFFHYLKKLKIYDETIIILTSDHGDEIFEHNSLSHYASLYDELLRVPLLIKYPDLLNEPKLINNLVELIDIAPTIIDLLDFPPEKDFKGISLGPLMRNDKEFNHQDYVISLLIHNNKSTFTAYKKEKSQYFLLISCRSIDWKLIYDDQTKKIELFNLISDPKELINLSISEKDTVITMKKKFLKKIDPFIKIYESEEGKMHRSISKFLLDEYSRL